MIANRDRLIAMVHCIIAGKYKTNRYIHNPSIHTSTNGQTVNVKPQRKESQMINYESHMATHGNHFDTAYRLFPLRQSQENLFDHEQANNRRNREK